MRRFVHSLFTLVLLAAVAAISAQVDPAPSVGDTRAAIEPSAITAALSHHASSSGPAAGADAASPTTLAPPSVPAAPILPAFRSEPANTSVHPALSTTAETSLSAPMVPMFRGEPAEGSTSAVLSTSAAPNAPASLAISASSGEPPASASAATTTVAQIASTSASAAATPDPSSPMTTSALPSEPVKVREVTVPEAPALPLEGAQESTATAQVKTALAVPKSPAKTAAPVAARILFGAAKTAAPLQARSIGFYAKGCLAGAQALSVDGPAWQAMRLSRNRNWGHPATIAWVERFAKDAQKHDEWPGLLVGDISQPRGGPMLTGHASHQVGLDVDLWLTQMPNRRLSEKEREDIAATSMLGPDSLSVDPQRWTPAHAKLIKRAATYKEVERVLVHPAIKKALCEGAASLGADRSWLHKVRPIWGHYYHFHVRLACPKDSTNCEAQPAPPGEDGCGKEVTDWLKRIAASLKPAKQPDDPSAPKAQPPKPRAPLTLAQLPGECRAVLAGGQARPAATAAQRKIDSTTPASTAH